MWGLQQHRESVPCTFHSIESHQRNVLFHFCLKELHRFYFELTRGLGQGCPLSGALFRVSVEIMACAMRGHSDIKGIAIGNTDIVLAQYADTSVFIKNIESGNNVLSLLSLFEECSGLALNKNKTESMWIGKWREIMVE